MCYLDLDIATMKVAVLLACTYAVLSSRTVSCAAIQAPLSIISLEDLTESEREHLEYLDKTYFPRSKRSGSDVLGALKATIGQGIKSKIGMIAKSSAYISGGSSGGHSYHHYDGPETYDHKSFDFWSLKKSILNTLLQAVKAIKGGVIAIKGQLIKGSGYLISAKGKLISAKGEAISSLGKHIASSALLSPHPHHGHSGPGHAEYHESPDHYPHHSGPSAEYGAPSAPGPEYEVPEHFHHPPPSHYEHHPPPPVHHEHHHEHHHEEKPSAPEAGILIIKKIPKHGHLEHHESEDHHDDKIPDFKPIKPSGPSFSTIIGKFFSASTSLKPGEPKPFGYTSPGHDSYNEGSPHAALHDTHPHYTDSSHNDDHSPPFSSHQHESDISSHHNNHDSSHEIHDSPPIEYGSPFEKAPSYLHEEESKSSNTYTSELNGKKPQQYDEVRPLNLALNSQAYDEIRPLPTAFSNTGQGSAQISDYFSASLKQEDSFPPYPEQQHQDSMTHNFFTQNSNSSVINSNFETFRAPGTETIKYLSPPGLDLAIMPNQASLGLGAYRTKALSPNSFHHSGLKKVPIIRKPTRNIRTTKKRNRPSINVVKSIGYELGPDGPTRI